MSDLHDAMRRCIAAYKDLPVLDAPPADMNDCEHKWSLMRVPYECPYCLRERAERAEAERDEWKDIADKFRDQNLDMLADGIGDKTAMDALRALLRDAVSKMRMVENHVCPPDEWDETVEAIDAALGEKP